MGATSTPQGEFLVNQTTTGNRMWPAVATDAEGDFVVTWTSYGQDGAGNGYGAGYGGLNAVYVRRFNSNTTPESNEFLVNAYTANNQQHSSVAMDSAGDFTIAWESYQERQQNTAGTNSSVPVNYGIYAQQYARASELTTNASLGPNGQIGGEIHVNTATAGDQRYPSVAMDDTGDSIIDWFGPSSSPSPEGIFMQSFDQPSDTAGPVVGQVLNPTPAPTTPAANTLTAAMLTAASDSVGTMQVASNIGFPTGNQLFNVEVADVGGVGSEEMTVTSVANVGTGSVWTVVRGVDGTTPAAHAVGATVSLALLTFPATANDPVVLNGLTETGNVASLVVTFGDEMLTVGGALGFNSVLNKTNWTISYDGANISGGVKSVTSGGTAASIYDPTTGKYDVEVNFVDQASGTAGLSAQGTYVLTIGGNVEDAFGNFLDGSLNGGQGSAYTLTFNINANGSATASPPIPPLPGPPSPPGTATPGAYTTDTPINSKTQQPNIYPAVATDAVGDYVVVWQSSQGIVGELFNMYGIAQGGQFTVNTSGGGDVTDPAVAMDAGGDFVVTWCGPGPQDANGVYARIYDFAGNAKGDQFLVNTYTLGDTNIQPKVAMDPTGDFVISWTGYVVGASNNEEQIYYQRYAFSGTQLTAQQTPASAVAGRAETNSDVAIDAAGNFIIVWQEADGSGLGIFAQEFVAANGYAGNGQFLANTITDENQSAPSVAMDAAGDFVIAWQNFGGDGSGYGVYARRFSAAGVGQGPETLVNQTTLNWQMSPQVSMSNNYTATGGYSSNYVVSWTTYGEPGVADFYSVYARAFTFTGGAAVPSQPGEFRVNANTMIDSGYLNVTSLQSPLPANTNPAAPDIAMDAYGNFDVVWASWNQGTGATNVFQRKMVMNKAPFLLPTQSTTGSSSSQSSPRQTTTTTTTPPATTTTTKAPTTTTTKPPATTTTTKPPTTTTTKPPTTTTTKPPTTTTTKPPTTTTTKPPTTTTTTKPPATTTTTKPPTTTVSTKAPTTTTKAPTTTTTTTPKPATTATIKATTTTTTTTTTPKPPTMSVALVKTVTVASTSTVSTASSGATSSAANSVVDEALKVWS